MDNSTEIQLLSDFKKGDVVAFGQVFKQFYKQLRLEAFLLLNDTNDAEDMVQQLFLDIWQKQLYANVDLSLRAYLHTAIRNRCLNLLDRKKTYEKTITEYADTLPAEGVMEPSSHTSATLPAHMETALASMPAQRLTAFNLVYMEEKRYKEAAMEMGVSINSLKTHLKIGLKFLRSTIERV